MPGLSLVGGGKCGDKRFRKRKMKLSKTQLEVLKELAEEGSFLHYMGYMGSFNPTAYWFFHKSMKNVRCSTERFLHKHGLISEYSVGGYNNERAKITDKGREFLKEK